MKDSLRPISFPELLCERFGEDFFAILEDFGRENPRAVRSALGCDGETGAVLRNVSLLRTESLANQSLGATAVDLLLRGRYVLRQGRREREKTGDFRLRYVLDFRGGRLAGPTVAAEREFPRDRITEQDGTAMDAFLLPQLTEADCPLLAEELLRELRVERSLRDPALNGKVLACKLGLKLYFVRFPEGSRHEGRVLFERTTVTLRDRAGKPFREEIPAFTVLVNRDFCRDDRQLNALLVHECAHCLLHLPFFLLQRMARGEKESDGHVCGQLQPAGMEEQADQLAAELLLPEKRLRREAERLTASGKSPERICAILAQRFRTPRDLVRERLYASGLFGAPVPDHAVPMLAGLFSDREAFPQMAAKLTEVRDHYLLPVLDAVPGTFARELENRRFLEDAALWIRMRDAIPPDTALIDAVNVIRKCKGLSWETLALLIGVNRATLARWLRNTDVTLPHMTALCVAMQLRPDVSERLIGIAECRIRRAPGWEVYWMMLEYAPCLTVERCNEILRLAQLPPLHESTEAA